MATGSGCSGRSQGVDGLAYVQSRELWRLRASLAETEAFSDVIRMDDIASSPELVTSSVTTSFDSNDRVVGRQPEVAVSRPPQLPAPHAQLVPGAGNSSRYVCSPAASLLLSGETRRQAYRQAIAQRWSAKNEQTAASVAVNVVGPTSGTSSASHVTGSTVGGTSAQPETSFDSIDTMETDGDVSDTSCSRPEITTTSFDSTTTTDNDVDSQQAAAGHRRQIQLDSGYKPTEVSCVL